MVWKKKNKKIQPSPYGFIFRQSESPANKKPFPLFPVSISVAEHGVDYYIPFCDWFIIIFIVLSFPLFSKFYWSSGSANHNKEAKLINQKNRGKYPSRFLSLSPTFTLSDPRKERSKSSFRPRSISFDEILSNVVFIFLSIIFDLIFFDFRILNWINSFCWEIFDTDSQYTFKSEYKYIYIGILKICPRWECICGDFVCDYWN